MRGTLLSPHCEVCCDEAVFECLMVLEEVAAQSVLEVEAGSIRVVNSEWEEQLKVAAKKC